MFTLTIPTQSAGFRLIAMLQLRKIVACAKLRNITQWVNEFSDFGVELRAVEKAKSCSKWCDAALVSSNANHFAFKFGSCPISQVSYGFLGQKVSVLPKLWGTNHHV